MDEAELAAVPDRAMVVEASRVRGLVAILVPIVLALVLALVTLPLTVVAMMWVDTRALGSPEVTHLTLSQALSGSLGAVIAGALVGGAIGGRFVRRYPLTGAVIALVTAWPAAVIGFTILPSLEGHPFAVGTVCLDTCGPAIDMAGEDAGFGIVSTYLTSLVMGVPVLYGAPLLPALAGVFTRFFARASRVAGIASFALLAVAVAAVNVWSVAVSGPAFLVLTAGVGLWALVLHITALRAAAAGRDRVAVDGAA